MLQIIEFANATGENIRAIASITIPIIISLFAVAISFLTLYFTHLRSMSISSFLEYELSELPANKFKNDVPTSLPLKVNLTVLNSGNRAGIVKDFDLKFKPHLDFEDFSEEKSFSDLPILPFLIKDRDTNLVNFEASIDLDMRIRMGSSLNTVDIKSDNLNTLLEEMLEYKKQLLKKFVTFLKENEKLGKLMISYRYTKPKFVFLPSIEFKKKNKSLEIRHSYIDTIKYYADYLENYQLSRYPAEIIKGILKSIEILKDEFTKSLEAIESFLKEDTPRWFPRYDWIKNIINNAEEDTELLSKCTNYRKTMEEDVKPLLRELLKVYQNVQKAGVAPTEELKRSLFEKIKQDGKELKPEIKDIIPKLEELKREVKKELKEYQD